LYSALRENTANALAPQLSLMYLLQNLQLLHLFATKNKLLVGLLVFVLVLVPVTSTCCHENFFWAESACFLKLFDLRSN